MAHLGGTEGMLLAGARARRDADPTLSQEEKGRLDEAVALITETAGPS